MGKISTHLCAVLFLAVWVNASAQTVVLKNGQRVEGEITEQTDKYVKVRFEGVDMVLYKEDIDSIQEGQPREVPLDKSIVTPQMGSLYKSYLQSLSVPLSGKKETVNEAQPVLSEEPAAEAPQAPAEARPHATAVVIPASGSGETSDYQEFQKKRQEEKKNASGTTQPQTTPVKTPAKATPVKSKVPKRY